MIGMIEERKRTYEGPNDIPISAGGNQIKRLRPGKKEKINSSIAF